MSDEHNQPVENAEEIVPYDEELVALIREKGTEGLNEWREANPGKEVNLRGAQLPHAELAGAELMGAHLEKAFLFEAHFEDANLWDAHLEGASLWDAHFEDADLKGAHLQSAFLGKTHCEGMSLFEAHLEGTYLDGATLTGMNARFAIVDGETLITNCTCDINTDFTGVGLGSCRIDPEIRATLEYNIRRKHWRIWYHKTRTSWLCSWPWWFFWMLSDYGRSTGRLLCSFYVFAFLFAVLYLLPTPTWFPEWCPTLSIDPFVTNLEHAPNADNELVPIEGFQLVSRTLYFSIVTMTTLGFGDIHANPESWFGHWILMAQVLLGYFLLGALITRLGILFQSVE